MNTKQKIVIAALAVVFISFVGAASCGLAGGLGEPNFSDNAWVDRLNDLIGAKEVVSPRSLDIVDTEADCQEMPPPSFTTDRLIRFSDSCTVEVPESDSPARKVLMRPEGSNACIELDMDLRGTGVAVSGSMGSCPGEDAPDNDEDGRLEITVRSSGALLTFECASPTEDASEKPDFCAVAFLQS